MVTGSKEVCSQENLVAADVTYRFFFLFFRILPVMVISFSLLFWFNRLVFVFRFFGRAGRFKERKEMQYFHGIFETRFALGTRVWLAD